MCSFFGYPEISIFYPQTKYFRKNVNFRLFKKGHFWGCDVEKSIFAKMAVQIWPILWIRVKKPFTQLSLTFIHENRPYRPFYSKNDFFHILTKKMQFLNRKSSLEASKRVRWGNHGSPKSAKTFPTNPQLSFFDMRTLSFWPIFWLYF